MPVLLQLGNLYRFTHIREITKPAPIGIHPEESRRSGHRPKLRNSFGADRLSDIQILDDTEFAFGNNNKRLGTGAASRPVFVPQRCRGSAEDTSVPVHTISVLRPVTWSPGPRKQEYNTTPPISPPPERYRVLTAKARPSPTTRRSREDNEPAPPSHGGKKNPSHFVCTKAWQSCSQLTRPPAGGSRSGIACSQGEKKTPANVEPCRRDYGLPGSYNSSIRSASSDAPVRFVEPVSPTACFSTWFSH
jgi:hypothetical protein